MQADDDDKDTRKEADGVVRFLTPFPLVPSCFTFAFNLSNLIATIHNGRHW